MGEIDWGLQIWTLVTFAVLVFLLGRFAFRPLQSLLAQREESIRESLRKAEEAHSNAETVLAENEKRLGRAREDARKIINEGHRIAASMKTEARERASEEAEVLVRHARSEIDRELQKSLEDLKRTVAGLSVRISRQVLNESLDDERHAALADDFIERLKKTHAIRRD